jgi:hypothetical protein
LIFELREKKFYGEGGGIFRGVGALVHELHLVDEIVLLQDVEYNLPDDRHLQDPHEYLHQEPSNSRS